MHRLHRFGMARREREKPGCACSHPDKGCVVFCRSHHHLVEDVWTPEEDGLDTVVRLAYLHNDANAQITEVFWLLAVDARVLGQSTWETIGQQEFDDPRVFSSYLHTLQWNCVTDTDPWLFQAPLRAGIAPRIGPAGTTTTWPLEAGR